MSKSMAVFVQEANVLCGRGFALVEYEIEGGRTYHSADLFTSRAAAERDLKRMVAISLFEDDEYRVTDLTLHADGSLFDDKGREVVSHLASQNHQTVEEVKTCLRHFYDEEQSRLQRKSETSSEGPGF